VGQKRKKDAVAVKIGLEKPSLLHSFFLMRTKYLYTYTVFKTAMVYIHSIQDCDGWSGSMFAVAVDILSSTFKSKFAENS